MKFSPFSLILFFLLFACSRPKYSVTSKLSPTQMQQDFSILKKSIEKDHPAPFWYITKSSFDSLYQSLLVSLKDSLTHFQFRQRASKLVGSINCGHTSVRSPQAFVEKVNNSSFSLMPLGFRVIDTQLIVSYNLYKRADTILPRGTVVRSINGMGSGQLITQLYKSLSTDAYANNFKALRLSGNFPYQHFLEFDTVATYTYEYFDTLGSLKSITAGIYRTPPKDTSKKRLVSVAKPKAPKLSRKKIKAKLYNDIRNLAIDTALNTAFLNINSFSGGRQRKFYKKTFTELNQRNIKNLVIDVRSNGGGFINNSTALTRYFVDKKFKIADSVYTHKRFGRSKYIKYKLWYGLSMFFITHKKRDGLYHFGWFERKKYSPRRKNNFTGNTYVITGGNSFSATTLFVNAVKDLQNVTIVGEETGGSHYGNSAVYIPNLTLPNSGLKVRLPVFKLVMDAQATNQMRGIVPEIAVPPTPQSIIKNEDLKMKKVLELIKGLK
jgi:hypothetical protein